MPLGLWKLTWLEIKIFVREPLGLLGTVAIPVLVFVFIGRLLGGRMATAPPTVIRTNLLVFASILVVLSAVLSLITIVAIYREGGILKRLRATPLRPGTILTAHVLAKLLFTAITLLLMVAAGRHYYPVGLHVPLIGFTAALLLTTLSIVSMGFLIASVVPTARFAQPIGSVLLYPMIAVSGLFVPIESLPVSLRAMARVLPLTYGVSLLDGILRGDSWLVHAGDVAALVISFVALTMLSVKLFRWE